MHIGSCAIFDGPPPRFDEILALIAGKLPQIPRHRQQVRSVPPTSAPGVRRRPRSTSTTPTALPEPASVASWTR